MAKKSCKWSLIKPGEPLPKSGFFIPYRPAKEKEAVMDKHEVFGEVIHAYTRADALADGTLTDLSALAREAGIKFPLAVSSGVFAVLAPWAQGVECDISTPTAGQPLHGLGQSIDGRAWDLLTILLCEIRRGKGGERVDFAPLFLMPRSGDRPIPVKMYAVVGPGDDTAPVITVMLLCS